jgi:hypothetical protein
VSVAKLCVLTPAGEKIRYLRSASSYYTNWYTNWYTNPSETPVNIGEHFMRENGLDKLFCEQLETAANLSSPTLDQ